MLRPLTRMSNTATSVGTDNKTDFSYKLLLTNKKQFSANVKLSITHIPKIMQSHEFFFFFVRIPKLLIKFAMPLDDNELWAGKCF